MASYWKSNPRRMCDICKCWIADNKASIEFHERGKSHQEKKKRYLNDIRKRSAAKAKEESKLNGYLKQMEAAALKQYSKDIGRKPVALSHEVRTNFASLAPPPVKKQKIKLQVRKEEYKPPSEKIAKEEFATSSAPSYGQWVPVEPPKAVVQVKKEKEEFDDFEFNEKKVNVKKPIVKVEPGVEQKPAVFFKKKKKTNRTVRPRAEEQLKTFETNFLTTILKLFCELYLFYIIKKKQKV